MEERNALVDAQVRKLTARLVEMPGIGRALTTSGTSTGSTRRPSGGINADMATLLAGPNSGCLPLQPPCLRGMCKGG